VLLLTPRHGARAGNAGDPAAAGSAPPPFSRRAGQWLVLPAVHLFGSEELSALSPSAASLVPAPYVGLAAEDMAALGVEEGQEVVLQAGDAELRAAARARKGLVPGVALVPAGIAAGLNAALGGWVNARVTDAGVPRGGPRG
jgi:NADH-quinone oxidoreductase subunit G